MFKKAHTTKPAYPISGSAKKKLTSQLNLAPHELSNATITIAKAYNHLHQALTIYYHAKEPIYFQISKNDNNQLIPTIYTLLRNPELLPRITTNQLVLDKLAQGADLMIPGLLKTQLEQLPDLKKNQLVSVSGPNPHDPIWAVGFLADDIANLISADTGKAVITIHTQNDYLWNSGPRRIPERLAEPAVAEEPQLEKLSLEDESPTSQSASPSQPAVKAVTKPPAQDVDRFLQSALLMTLWKGDRLEAELPMPASLFYSDHILPNRPCECPKAVAVKDSSAKNLAKWIKLAHKSGFIKAKEERKGAETMVVALNLEHPELATFSKFRTIADQEKEDSKHDPGTQEAEAKPSSSAWTLPKTEIVELFRAKKEAGVLCWIWQTELDQEGLHPRHAVKRALAAYLNAQVAPPTGGSKPVDRSLVRPDPVLIQALPPDTLPDGPVSRNKLAEIVLEQAFEPWWRLVRDNVLVVERKGQMPGIVIKMKKKAGPKQATLVAGVEVFGIEPIRLAKELKVLCAGSTTTHPVPSNHPSTAALSLATKHILPQLTAHFLDNLHYASEPGGLVEVECQGDRRTFIQTLLVEKFGVPKAFVTVL
ncbi:hypothetical protein PTTG_27993 [Puccinia triticina 1-1 BBBD Race 1]|uniref:SUI1 domain-containing protein n=2 Tax=Puccinia triticina TaxID=208348 RepID=A0A180GF82_PUCT1|nr:uncharacterized protein PtA15_16A405 [Puccinia triticina]OAV91315.1 hypothetical protein PTTG_27993 [Puccinia triticina 1-1 BBBD Race 1]WAQ92497.1 hypothetical protein PtA15_16A405 [Puccinia triticina]WAR64243.1 hypothetical protein PtB15_16B403 [Puccinia triticina]